VNRLAGQVAAEVHAQRFFNYLLDGRLVERGIPIGGNSSTTVRSAKSSSTQRRRRPPIDITLIYQTAPGRAHR
jgi:hypothetical protein